MNDNEKITKIYSLGELTDSIIEAINSWVYKDKIERLYLFGSYARGEANYDSDIDLRVELNDDASVFDHGALKNYLEEELLKKVDLIEIGNNSLFLPKIKNNEILIYQRKNA